MNKLDLEETTRRFHYIYEQVAKEYGYKTREDTKELDFNSPNGMTMLKTVEMITTPYLEEIERLGNELQVQIEDNTRLSEYIEEQDRKLQQKENIIKEVREYIMTELITEWNIKNNGYVSGSDLPVDAITPILEILDKVGSDKE